MVLDMNWLKLNEGAAVSLDRVRLPYSIIIDHGGHNVVGEVAHAGIVGYLGRFDETHVDDSLVLYAIGKILDVLGPEKVVTVIAHVIGDVNPHGAQGVQTIAAARLQVMVFTGQRVHHHHQGILASSVLDCTNGVRRIDIDIIGYLGFLGITLGKNSVIGR